ncbi:unnamed protein product [Closterium sp. NIES-54]
MAITEATRPEIPVVGPINSDCTSVITNCCNRSSINSGGGTEFSSEGWSIKTSFADVDAPAAAIAAAASTASESSTSTNGCIQGNGGSAPSNLTPASPAAAATAAAAAESAAAAAAIAAATASPTWEDELQAQMQEWFHDSDWLDEPPSITVTMGSGAVCQLDCTATVALPPDAVFNVVRDPHNRRVFKNVKVGSVLAASRCRLLFPLSLQSVSDVRVVSDDGAVQHAEMNMTFLWRLPAISGSFTAQVLMIQDRPNRMPFCYKLHLPFLPVALPVSPPACSLCPSAIVSPSPHIFQLSYELTRPGFMKKFQGFWKVEPLVVSSTSEIGGTDEADDRGSHGSTSSSTPPTLPSSPNNPSNISKSNSSDSVNSDSSSDKAGVGSEPSWSPISILSYDSCPDLLAFAKTAEAAGTASVLALPADACPGSAIKSHDAVMEGASSAATAASGAVAVEAGGEVSPAPSAAAKRVASRIVLHQTVQPSVAPPLVFRKCLKGILQTAMRDMLEDFLSEAALIRCGHGERLGETEEGGKEAQIARERAGKRTASFLHKEMLRASGSAPGSKVLGSGGGQAQWQQGGGGTFGSSQQQSGQGVQQQGQQQGQQGGQGFSYSYSSSYSSGPGGEFGQTDFSQDKGGGGVEHHHVSWGPGHEPQHHHFSTQTSEQLQSTASADGDDFRAAGYPSEFSFRHWADGHSIDGVASMPGRQRETDRFEVTEEWCGFESEETEKVSVLQPVCLSYGGKDSRVSLETRQETAAGLLETPMLQGAGGGDGWMDSRMSSRGGGCGVGGSEEEGRRGGERGREVGDKVEIGRKEENEERETEEKEKKQEAWSSYETVFTNAKAGMEGVDKERVKRIVYAMSQGSRFFQHEQRKEAVLLAKIAHMQRAKQAIPPEKLALLERQADGMLARMVAEASREGRRVWVHVDMDAFYAAVEALGDARLRDVPMAVGGMGMLCTANYEARKYGVRAAMPGFIARKLCPELVFVPPDFTKYQHYSNLTHEVFRQYDPHFVARSLDEAYLDITAVCKERSMTPAQVAEELRHKVHAHTGLTCSAGVAANRMLAKVCSDINKPNGQYVLPFDREAILSFISSLPIRKIGGVGKVTERLLRDVLGVTVCADIITHRGALLALFSPISAEFFLQAALGIGGSGDVEEGPRKSISCERTFSPLSAEPAILNKLEELSFALAKDLEEHGMKGRTLTLKLKTTAFEVRTRAVSVPEPIGSQQEIWPLVVRLIRAELPVSVRLLGEWCRWVMSGAAGCVIVPNGAAVAMVCSAHERPYAARQQRQQQAV